ncbi:hypothetical protein [Planotetraspora phitsanulokensis]|nr:hypothetical protein [Planotetraspora phitsanulokensis]
MSSRRMLGYATSAHISDFDNTRRRHSAADGLGPAEYEQQIMAA